MSQEDAFVLLFAAEDLLYPKILLFRGGTLAPQRVACGEKFHDQRTCLSRYIVIILVLYDRGSSSDVRRWMYLAVRQILRVNLRPLNNRAKYNDICQVSNTVEFLNIRTLDPNLKTFRGMHASRPGCVCFRGP